MNTVNNTETSAAASIDGSSAVPMSQVDPDNHKGPTAGSQNVLPPNPVPAAGIMVAIPRKVDIAMQVAQSGIPVFPKVQNRCLKGSRGAKDATCDTDTIYQWFRDTPDCNFHIPTGSESGVVAISLSMPSLQGQPLFNPVASIREAMAFSKADVSQLVLGNLRIVANGEYLLVFKHTDSVIYTREAVRPGLDVIAEYGDIPLVGSEYGYGKNFKHWDSAVSSDENPGDGFLRNLNAIPDTVKILTEMESPFYAVRKGTVTLDGVQAQLLRKLEGEEAKRDLHDALCRFRGLGVEHEVYFDCATVAAKTFTDESDRQWALACAKYIWRRYRPCWVPQLPHPMVTLESFLEF